MYRRQNLHSHNEQQDLFSSQRKFNLRNGNLPFATQAESHTRRKSKAPPFYKGLYQPYCDSDPSFLPSVVPCIAISRVSRRATSEESSFPFHRMITWSMRIVILPDIRLISSKLDTNSKCTVNVAYLLDWSKRVFFRKGHQSFFFDAGIFLTSSNSFRPVFPPI
jgi:hypothetical protein